MNDICNISNFLFNIMYADETSVLLSGDDLKDLTCLLNKELELLFIYLLERGSAIKCLAPAVFPAQI